MEDSERIGRKQSLSPTVAIIKLGGQTFVPVGDTRILEGDMLLTIEDMPRKERGRWTKRLKSVMQ
ncbi:hypothetical protein CLOSCI_03949 [[Clostridium] scindens ATCC 35704]|uniref:hypothetical protein n=2 Tax=Clostridium scindens (strain JCM 10418 / VPI 12708) TaxID=29347 RepID=UPI0001658671|nr:hypothetical protein [[Clostridium] scindens]EDS05334.1 hypothetical protein CLOSCI_03949 [[Clostridium] scindens ATCC 35704]BDF15109.1 hypothetical protein CE91St59_03720 [[Clostridium] scindens]BDF18796.1 hypothetical protein CE91St60_03790 [[Clostridium] scindens]